MRESNNGRTVGITLRLTKELLQIYVEIAHRANLVDIQQGRRGANTVQDVLRHRLASLPLLKVRKKKLEGESGNGKA